MDSLSGMSMFVTVAETRSFKRTATQLGVSSSAVGKSIARMEERLAVRLFHRSTRSITLTTEGVLFLERCRRILGEVAAAEAELSELSGTPRGRLRVSTPQLTHLVMPTLTGFMRRYPDIALDIDLSERMVDIVEEGYDAVIRTGTPTDSRLSARRIGSCPQVVLATPGYLAVHGTPDHPRELAHTPACCTAFPPPGASSAGRSRWTRANPSRSSAHASPAAPSKRSATPCWKAKASLSCPPSSSPTHWRTGAW